MANEYVLKEDILKYLEKKSNISINTNSAIGKEISRVIDVIYCDVDNMVSADVQRVKRGEWGKRAYNRVQCSYCGKCEDIATDFCPNCGADMRGEENE